MHNNYKPGGGSKPQPYVPAGNGAKSGEYTTKVYPSFKNKKIYSCNVPEKRKRYNYFKSTLVKKVTHIFSFCHKLNEITIPNTVEKKSKMVILCKRDILEKMVKHI